MINLAGLKEGETVCDPFCGTGTTLLEAESMGIHGIGLDYDKKMCEITKENLQRNGYDSEVFNSDFQEFAKISKESMKESLPICHTAEHQRHQKILRRY